MGNEVSARTKDAFVRSLKEVNRQLDQSIEREREKNDFLVGVPAIVDGIQSGKIRCRIYRRDKFHAKAYITHARLEVVGSAALVGSSNLSYPGLTENIELNIQIRREVSQLQDWFERYWKDAKEVTPELLKVVERQIREYPPFEVY